MQTIFPYTHLNVYACSLCAEPQSKLDGCSVPALYYMSYLQVKQIKIIYLFI